MTSRSSPSLPWFWALALGAALAAPEAFATAPAPSEGQEPRQLRVCAHPDNLPFSNRNEEGFENRIATLIAHDLNATVSYTWSEHRRGFLRNTLKAGVCDVVVGVPHGLEAVATTRPYYRSSYAFVYRGGRFRDLRSLDDPRLRELKIGVTLVGEDRGNPPPAHALARRQLSGNVVGYPLSGDASSPVHAASVVEAVAAGEADIALMWGPVAGYFAARQLVPLTVVPVAPAFDPPDVPMQFDISVGVRPGDTGLRDELDSVLERRREDIRKILRGYGVPLVPETVLNV